MLLKNNRCIDVALKPCLMLDKEAAAYCEKYQFTCATELYSFDIFWIEQIGQWVVLN